jgi:hypothetical protein
MARGRGGFIGQDGLNAPDSPTAVSATAGDAQATVAFTAPTDVGGSAITGFRAQSNPSGIGVSGSSSPITVTGLSNGTSYTFNVWAINAFGYSAPSDASTGVSPVATEPNRAIVLQLLTSGYSATNSINYFDISSTGNASDFGDLRGTAYENEGAASSTTRAITAYGLFDNSRSNVIDYLTIASTGNSQDFGDLTVVRSSGGGGSNDTRALFFGGQDGSGRSNVIDYVTIASTGNALDFGDMTVAIRYNAGCQSPTRALNGGGYTAGAASKRAIDYVTIASTGNAADFGDLISGHARYPGSASSNTRGLWFGGAPSNSNVIQYVTISSTGDAADFGDLIAVDTGMCGTSSSTRAVMISGLYTSNSIQYVTIASTGNATAFGDLTSSYIGYLGGATSGSHGGLS